MRRIAMRRPNSLPILIFFVILGIGLAVAYSVFTPQAIVESSVIAVCSVIVAFVAANSIRVADQWERAVVLRLGRFRALEGPGLFFIIPVFETVAYWIDIRVITSGFKAEKTLTKDTVPVNVDAVLFWKVIDPKKAALDVADYGTAISWASQTALRDVIGKTMLSEMLEGRDKISSELQKIIDARTEPWGVNVISVEVKDVLIPPALEDAMSMQAQAERERQARVILGDSERQVAEKFGEAAQTYANNPTALHLRAMNMLYEGLKSNNATIVIVPSSAVESMQLGGLAGMTALTQTLSERQAPAPAPGPWSGSGASV
ncbi:MAG: slipin family protein [Ancalomicrobiaceae bacterium]|nr:slipin family protein [Ancalomicrobiaceae bacterium]